MGEQPSARRKQRKLPPGAAGGEGGMQSQGRQREKGQQRENELPPSVPPPSKRKALGALLAYARPYRRTFIIILLCAFTAITADLVQPLLIKIAIDDHLLASDGGGRTVLITIGLSYLALAIIALVLSYIQANLLQKVGQGIVAQLRKDLFRHISGQSMAFFDRHPIGSLVTNESSDTETISQFFTQVLLSLVRDGLSLIMIIGFLFMLDARLALYSLLLLPLIALIAIGFRRLLRSAYQQARAQLSRMIAFLAENLAGMSLIQAFHQEQEQEKQFSHRNGRFLRDSLREVRTSVVFNRSFDILGNLAVAFIVWAGGMAVFNKQLEFGVLYAFISYIRLFFQPINQITQQWNTLQSTIVSAERLWRIFSIQPEVKEAPPDRLAAADGRSIQGAISFNQIRFSYNEEREVLRGLDLHIAPGEFVGIVGTTGAGKSSLVNMLARFYDVQSGSVEIDGVDVRRLPQAALHRAVGIVQQEPFLFSGSIVDNVRLFDSAITREQVIEACKAVGADPLIRRLADGYDTRLSERGSGLSAGERQLISFARIVVYQPRILILDEATAHLDSHTERLIQQALAVVAEGRTTLVIAHRLSTIRHADRIVAMQEGQIVEEGSHAALMRRGGYYAELIRHSSQQHGGAKAR